MFVSQKENYEIDFLNNLLKDFKESQIHHMKPLLVKDWTKPGITLYRKWFEPVTSRHNRS